MLTSVLAGFAASAVLIIAIGAQNAFVLRQGLRREHVLPVVLTCALSDLALISAGIAGLGAVVTARPELVTAIRWIGAAFLIGYAVLAARRALRPEGSLDSAGKAPATLRATLLTCLALTYLNPHVYLDTVLLLGSVAQQHPHRWGFGLGAAAASLTWFATLGLGAHKLGPLLARPGAWRVLDGLIALVMAGVAASLLIPA
ncbi:LysE/ArgO family amino acid transporter [Actinoplanes regularis]|uniref:L-lysine exporter family protein LysE/ArgO n=1 Tax=Actinoplanes regularis TaxID=52697 RepID=A0A238V7L9_9ACTN|nr:LysE/ArgO family amino acid transporter [Actinoplanes regularis]GIE83782.1 amino acid transporter [Actinoplanes regularis]GLW29677.1 amino acid transporter [Actinoplanes regularis]SNR30236.1 L-lysine exporter family protein LysE/ArgO [Actinoplanes regularis]